MYNSSGNMEGFHDDGDGFGHISGLDNSAIHNTLRACGHKHTLTGRQRLVHALVPVHVVAHGRKGAHGMTVHLATCVFAKRERRRRV